jgi:hypothetical protein
MRNALFALLVAAMAAAPAVSANAQSTGAGGPGKPAEPREPRTETPSPNITVEGERPICRARARTGTRMGTSRVCKTRQEWEALRAQDRNSDEAADTLDVLGADDISTGDVGDPLNRTPDTPLGPR